MLNYTLYLIRHGITEGNLSGQYIGRTDLALSDEGYSVIAGYSQSDFYPKVQKVYTSPLKRCLETAEIIYPDNYTKEIEAITECDFGEFEGKTREDLAYNPEYTEWLKGGYDARAPGGESFGEFTIRCIGGLDEIFHDMMKEKVTTAAVITHSGVIMSLLSGYGLPKGKPMDFAVKQGEGFEICLSTFLWSKGPAFEIIGRIF